MLAILAAMTVATGLMLALQGGNDVGTDDSWSGRAGPVPGAPLAGLPGPPVATPIPEPTDGPEPSPPESGADAAAASAAETGTAPERGPQPEPTGERPAVMPDIVPAGQEALVDGVALTFYTCVGDSTGAYCGTMASGQTVHRGAAACGYVWELGTRFRILGDPYPDTIYTCLDRGGGSWLWVDVWFSDATEGRAWRDHLPQQVTVEMMP